MIALVGTKVPKNLPKFITIHLSRGVSASHASFEDDKKTFMAVPRRLSSTSPLETQTPEPAHIMSIVDQISKLKFHEVNLLNEALRRELKIPDIQQMVAAGPAVTNAQAADGDEAADGATGVKTNFTVKLAKYDESKKVALIKEIKKLVEGINLVEAKRFVEECPRVIRSNLSKDEAEALQKQLEAAGGVVKLE